MKFSTEILNEPPEQVASYFSSLDRSIDHILGWNFRSALLPYHLHTTTKSLYDLELFSISPPTITNPFVLSKLTQGRELKTAHSPVLRDPSVVLFRFCFT